MSVFDNEKYYKAKNGVGVTYLEDPFGIQNYEAKNKLLIIFQSLGDEKSDKDSERFPWTMVNGFRYLNCRKIYIKDNYGLCGCYYLGLNGKFDVEVAIEEFIKSKINEYGILLKNVMYYGNSKGGYAALDFGFKIGGGYICSAVPQYDLYNWIIKYKPYLNYIFPNNSTDEEVIQLYKEHLGNIITESSIDVCSVVIITSHRDHTFSENIPALQDVFERKKINYSILYNDELFVTRHNNVVVNSLNWIYYIISKWLVNEMDKI